VDIYGPLSVVALIFLAIYAPLPVNWLIDCNVSLIIHTSDDILSASYRGNDASRRTTTSLKAAWKNVAGSREKFASSIFFRVITAKYHDRPVLQNLGRSLSRKYIFDNAPGRQTRRNSVSHGRENAQPLVCVCVLYAHTRCLYHRIINVNLERSNLYIKINFSSRQRFPTFFERNKTFINNKLYLSLTRSLCRS